jgi:hypothetical protein
MARMNWNKVRAEAQIARYGSKPLEVWLMKPDKRKPKKKKRHKKKNRVAPKITETRVKPLPIENQQKVPTSAEEAVRQAMAEAERHTGGALHKERRRKVPRKEQQQFAEKAQELEKRDRRKQKQLKRKDARLAELAKRESDPEYAAQKAAERAKQHAKSLKCRPSLGTVVISKRVNGREVIVRTGIADAAPGDPDLS